jgi:CRP-like cAMP-binding protein
MNTESVIALLCRQPFAAGLEEREVEQLAMLGRVAHYDKGRIVLEEGKEAPEFFLVVSGSIALEIAPPSGIFRVDTLGPGDEFGWSAVMDQGTLFQSRALTDATLLAFDALRLRALCERDSAFGYKFMRRLLAIVADRLQVTRLLLMDSHWPVARRAGA